MPREQPVEQSSARSADMQVAGRRRRKAEAGESELFKFGVIINELRLYRSAIAHRYVIFHPERAKRVEGSAVRLRWYQRWQTADPSARTEVLGRDDNASGVAQRL